MSIVEKLKADVLNGKNITRQDALELYKSSDLNCLCNAADEIRQHFCGNGFDICSIINGKCGRCSEDCKYCSQSSHYKTEIEGYSLLSTAEIVSHAKSNADSGVLRYSIVTSGKNLDDKEIDEVCKSIRAIKGNVDIEVCVSFGLLSYDQLLKIKKAGATRVHCNLETSRNYFESVCTTHTYDDKIETLKAAKKAGLSICSGGIMGLGESIEDRIDLAYALKELNVKSVPVNFLNPVPGTPYENNVLLSDDEKKRIIAVYRFILPDASIRLAGGRGLIADKGEGCFQSGANAAITGDMLTTVGVTQESDMKMIERLGFRVMLLND